MTITWSTLPELRREEEINECDVVVIGVEKSGDDVAVRATGLSDDAVASLRAAAAAVGHTGEVGRTARVPAPPEVPAASVLLVGLGDPGREVREGAADRAETLRRAAGTALRTVDAAASVTLAIPLADVREVEALVTGALGGAYRFTAYAAKADEVTVVRSVVVIADVAADEPIARALVVARAIAAARDLVNHPPLDLYPESFGDAVVQRAAELDGAVSVEVIDDAQLRERGFGGLIGVGAGAQRGPRLVKVSYAPEQGRQHLALVGKGITFDSGGISIKPAARMELMKSDMAGAAAAVEALFAVAALGLPVRVTAWLALAENMPSGSAVRPSDVLRIYGGKTVEVINTDAEGRLVLADALVAAQEESPDLVVDIATLTGAQVVALGRRTFGTMGSPAARESVVRAAEAAGEQTWPMPIPEELIRGFESSTADLKNTGEPAAGMLGAAAFLREFIGDGVEWAHLDVAGPAYNADAPHGYTPLGGTGVPVRTLIELARALADR